MDEYKRLLKEYQRKDKIADVQNSKNITPKIDQRLAKLK